MIRKIIKIDEEKCNGCGICASACHEGAIDIVNGKAKLVRENFCDGFGDCLPGCPTGAITFEDREAPAYDEAAVKAAQQNAVLTEDSDDMSVKDIMKIDDETKRKSEMMAHLAAGGQHPAGGCPGSRMMQFKREEKPTEPEIIKSESGPVSRLNQWPCQIKLLPTQAPFFEGAKLLIAADCTAYAYANMHEEFMKGKITIIGCPKLDDVDYTEKLTAIIRDNDIKSVTIVRMEVPCCGGLQRATENALRASGKFIPWQVVTISCDGHILG
ncbi:4Fe-4S binding domain-containing protein [Oribacterium sp. KHPX15]|uniref:ATP-binding protein n=1 Tax=Oribacterium sp. KHPX15 TaxID=1855342 RepID=UPI0008968243|nr:4Fe-4S dicluster domain-containing protein [Oribacterium sp. KHPX15]SEA01189.1 4Fe-4S binding domain-containing protein [Oribacterium sp. KHPX15]